MGGVVVGGGGGKHRHFIQRAVRQKAAHVIIACFLSRFHAPDSQTERGFARADIKRLTSAPLWEKTGAA